VVRVRKHGKKIYLAVDVFLQTFTIFGGAKQRLRIRVVIAYSRSTVSRFVVEQALWSRTNIKGLIHHSD
jgi:hypothetical protein